MKKFLENALNENIVITKANKKTNLTKADLGIRHFVNQFAQGDRYARRDLMDYAAKLGVDLFAGQKFAIEEALGIDHQAIVDAFLSRQPSPSTPTEPEVRVKAPSDLVDDDVVTRKPDEPVAPPKPAPLPKKPEPEPDQYGNPKPRDRAFIEAERAWNIAQQKRTQGEK